MQAKKWLLPLGFYVVATFMTQAVSHFVINAEHYAAIPFLRVEPVFPLGILAMLIQGTILAHLYDRLVLPGSSRFEVLQFAWTAGAFLASYIALGEASKYQVPGVVSWIAVELGAAFVQFTIYGVLLAIAATPRRKWST